MQNEDTAVFEAGASAMGSRALETGPKVFIRLSGGLGNQLFQMAYAIRVAQNFGGTIFYSTSGLKKYSSVHEYVLGEVVALSSYRTSRAYSSCVLPLRIPRLVPLQSTALSFVSDKNMHSFLDRRNGKIVVLDGYFQDVPLTSLRAIPLTPAFKEMRKTVADADLVIHVRGGDFFRLGFTDYRIGKFYEEAMSSLLRKTSIRKAVIVTDDPQFVSGIPSLAGIEICQQDTVRDFATLCFVRNRIFGSSTFALTAAALGDATGINISNGTWLTGRPRTYLLENEWTVSAPD